MLQIEGDDRERLVFALRLCITRIPTDVEVDQFLSLLQESREYYRGNVEDAKKLSDHHAAEDIEPAENAAWVATVRMILNLDEFIVRD